MNCLTDIHFVNPNRMYKYTYSGLMKYISVKHFIVIFINAFNVLISDKQNTGKTDFIAMLRNTKYLTTH